MASSTAIPTSTQRRRKHSLLRDEKPMREDEPKPTRVHRCSHTKNNAAVRRSEDHKSKTLQKLQSMRDHRKEQRKAICRLAERKFRKDRCKKTNQEVYDEAGEAAKLNHLPVFVKDEIRFGHKLGNGAFGNVFEVKNIVLEDQNSSSSITSNDLQTAARSFMAKHCLREDACESTVASSDDTCGNSRDEDIRDSSEMKMSTSCQSRYAIKKLRGRIVNGDAKTFLHAMIDMATETRLLASIPHHPNIIKLRGMAMCHDDHKNEDGSQLFPTYCFHEHYGLVLDRLYGTLEDRLEDWVQEIGPECPQRNGRFGKWRSPNAASNTKSIERRRFEEKLMSERLRACHDVASGLAHLHRHKIIHRDVKPPNIGFNIRGDLTLFDFGLSRELPETETKDSLWRLTGFVGSPRYMAPEVGLKRKYNASCDVYSFGILAWYIMTLQKPFQGCDIQQLKRVVWPGDKGIIGPADWAKKYSRDNSFNGSFRQLTRSVYDTLKNGSSKSSSKTKNKTNETSTTVASSEFDKLIGRTVSRNIAARPTMQELKDFLKTECKQHRRNCKANRCKDREDRLKMMSLPVSGLEMNSDFSAPSREFSCRRRSTYVFEFNDRQSCFRRSLEDNTHIGDDLVQSSLNSGNNCSDVDEESSHSSKKPTETSSRSLEVDELCSGQ